uniref:Uncharacterized protein n=1 Tax=Caenorhabditis japonica TaxID=281687 RepID=A0A8R1ENT7_CAEJA
MPLIEYADVDVEEQNRVLAISSIVM